MKASIPKLLISALVAASTAAAAATPLPAQGYILAYTVPECAKASTGGVLEPQDIGLPQGLCVDIKPPFMSFAAGLNSPCPAGETPSVLAFPEGGCTGKSPVSVSQFPPFNAQSECRDTVVNLAAVPPAVGGQSAKLVCQK